MVRRLAASLLLAVLVAVGWVSPALGGAPSVGGCTYSTTIQLVGNHIQDICGNAIVARGPEMVTASTDQTASIDAAAAMGANAIRMLLTLDAANGMTPAGFDSLLARAASHGMITWLSLYTWDHDHNDVIGAALGGGNFYQLTAPAGTGACSNATPGPCYLAVWSRQWLKDLVAKYKGHVIIDAGQEYIGVSDASSEAGRTEWANAAKVNVKWFRGAGYTVPLEIMTNYQGRDLYAIVEKGASIRAVDTVKVGADPQTMFGWQAYWAASWYKSWQGGLLLGSGRTITGVQAIHQFAVTQAFPIEVGFDNYGGDTASEYKAEIDQAAVDGASWLWWSWNGSNSVECPVDGATCQAYVTGSQAGFAGALPSGPGAATHLTVVTANPFIAGSSHSVTVTAKDAHGNTATGYLGTVHLTSSDPKAVVPADYAFTAADAGVHKFVTGLTLRTAGSRSVTATDTVTSSIKGSQSGIIVTPGAARTLIVSTATTWTAGNAHTVTVTARDAYGDTATGYLGTIHFTSTDTAAVLPANYAFTAADKGVHAFAGGLTVKTAGSRTVTATDTVTPSIKGTKNGIVVNPSVAKTLTLVGAVPWLAGASHSVTITAKDAYGNTATGYVGTVHLTSSDTAALLPADYTLVAADAGVHKLTVTLKTAGPQWIRATDTLAPTITGSVAITVS